MKILIHDNRDHHFDSKWGAYFEKNGIDYEKKNLMGIDFNNDLEDVNGVMWHFRLFPEEKRAANYILNTIEYVYHIPTWPNFQTRWHFDEKIAQHYLLKSIDVPQIQSWVFWDFESAKFFLENYESYPIVMKLSVGAGAANVFLVQNVDEALLFARDMFEQGIFPYTKNEFNNKSLKRKIKNTANYIRKNIIPVPDNYNLQKNYVYIQEYIPNSGDIRVTIIGDRAFAFCRENRENDFRASGSGRIIYDLSKIPLQAIESAFEVSKKLQFQSMAYDFLLNNEGQALINEISYGYNDRAVYECRGHWDSELKWHEGHMWPEEAQVQDFIYYIEQYKHSNLR